MQDLIERKEAELLARRTKLEEEINELLRLKKVHQSVFYLEQMVLDKKATVRIHGTEQQEMKVSFDIAIENFSEDFRKDFKKIITAEIVRTELKIKAGM